MTPLRALNAVIVVVGAGQWAKFFLPLTLLFPFSAAVNAMWTLPFSLARSHPSEERSGRTTAIAFFFPLFLFAS